MDETKYPAYVQRMLAAAAAMIHDENFGPAEAAAQCYAVLALFPAHAGAVELVYTALCEPHLIRDMRKSIGRHIDEWDDRPWQERRRLALSFRFMSRWDEPEHLLYLDERTWPDDVREMAEEARHQLMQDYLLGQSRGAELAWPIFQAAIRRTADPQWVLLAVGHLYADQGYFVEAVDVLEMLLARFPQDEPARRLWAEVRWWRDNQHRIPWIPPTGDGRSSRFRRMMTRMEPEFAQEESAWLSPLEHLPPDLQKLPADFILPPPFPEAVLEWIENTLPETAVTPDYPSPVDWSYLDDLETGSIDIGRLPEWAQYLLLDIDDPTHEAMLLQYILSYLANPPLHDDDAPGSSDLPDISDSLDETLF